MNVERVPRHEFEGEPVREGLPPIEVFNSPVETERVWGNPELTEQVRRRSELAGDIVGYLEDDNPGAEKLAGYFGAGAELLRDVDSRRLALYWPLENLGEATPEFREAYMDAWQGMLFSHDVREVYNDGDVYEVEARAGDPERVVKAAHLLPWLVKEEFLSARDVVDLARNSDDLVLRRSMLDAAPVLEEWGLMTDDLRAVFEEFRAELPLREREDPLFVSEARRAWLERKDEVEYGEYLDAALAGPFSENVRSFRGEVGEIGAYLPEGAVAFVGGSRLKGYGSRDSDLDVYVWGGGEAGEFVDRYHAEVLPEDLGANPELVHVVFDTLWVGSEGAMGAAREKLVMPYLELPEGVERDRSLERIELDLLAFRLMHKGFGRMYEDVSGATREYGDIDGGSAFYDPRYRKLATELYVKYVFLPKI